MAWESFIRRKSGTAGTSSAALSGPGSPPTPRSGNRRSRSTAANPGRQTGSIPSSVWREIEMTTDNDGRNDFNFLIGAWKVHHRTLKKRLHASTEWVEFEGDMVSRKILNGLGILDENLIQTKTGP